MAGLILRNLDGANGTLILAGLAIGAAALVLGVAYAAERRPYRTARETMAEAVKTLRYAANRACEAR